MPAKTTPCRPRRLGRLPAAFAFVALLAAPAVAADYVYVRLSGNDSNDGSSPASAYRTIGRALNNADPGDVIYVGGGTYNESLSPSRSGNSSGPISVVADTTGAQTGDAGEVRVRASSVLNAQNDNYLQFNGLVFESTGSNSTTVSNDSSDKLMLINCTIVGGGTGVYVRNGGDVWIERCTIQNASNRGVELDGGSHTILNTAIEDLTSSSATAVRARNNASVVMRGVRITDGQTGVYADGSNVTLINSIVWGSDGGMTTGMQGRNGGANMLVAHCLFSDITGDALNCVAGARFSVYNTIFDDIGDDCMDNDGGSFTTGSNVAHDCSGSFAEGFSASANTYDPDFVNPAAGDFRLSSTSPAIDSAPNGSSWTTQDIDGNTRPRGSGWDFGPHEFGDELTAASIPYEQDFEDPLNDGEWSDTTRDTSDGSLTDYLGQFGQASDGSEEAATLALATTPGETYYVTWDLYLSNSWDGGDSTWGPDWSIVLVDGDEAWREIREADDPTTASFSFVATKSVTTITFTADATEDKSNEAWGIDNVIVAGSEASVPYFTDFESSIGGEWSASTIDTTETTAFTKFLGRFGSGDDTSLRLSTTPGQTYTLGFDLYLIDSWGTEEFRVAVDGTTVLTGTHNRDLPNQPINGQTEAHFGQLGFGTREMDNDKIYRVLCIEFVASGTSTTITFSSTLDESLDDESWGIDNVTVVEGSAELGLSFLLNQGIFEDCDEIPTSSPEHDGFISYINWPTTSNGLYPGAPTDDFGVILTGQIDIPEPGVWRFRLTSDDGSVGDFDGSRVFDHDGHHGSVAQSRSLTLTAGLHDIEFRMWDQWGDTSMWLEWRGPSDSDYSIIPGWAFRQPPPIPPIYTDVTTDTGFGVDNGASTGSGGAFVWVDADADGDLDAFVAGSSARYMRNNAAGLSFSAVSLSTQAHSLAVGDFDHDGDVDFYSLDRKDLMEHDGASGFTDRNTNGFADNGSSEGGVAIDVDNDGDLDLVDFASGGNEIASNEGSGYGGHVPVGFSVLSNGATGLNDSGDAGGGDYIATADINNDGVPDFYYNRDSTGRVFLSNGDGTWSSTSVGITADVGNDRKSGPAWGDFDNDGDMDLFIPQNGSDVADLLYRNNGNGTFTNIATDAGVASTGPSRSAAWGDYDNDGDLDLLVAVGSGGPNILYRNNGDATFTAVTSEPFATDVDAIDASFVDYDNDGDLDIAISVAGDDMQLYENATDGAAFLKVRLTSGKAGINPDATGARVELWNAANTSFIARREVGQARGVGGTDAFWLHFGGVNPVATYTLRIYWPGSTSPVTAKIVPNDLSVTIGAHTISQMFDAQTHMPGVTVTSWEELGATD